MTTTTSQATALDAYMAHRDAALALLARIADAIENHDDAPSEGLHWGHVGDIAETEQQLQLMADRIFGEGEHAPTPEGRTCRNCGSANHSFCNR